MLFNRELEQLRIFFSRYWFSFELFKFSFKNNNKAAKGLQFRYAFVVFLERWKFGISCLFFPTGWVPSWTSFLVKHCDENPLMPCLANRVRNLARRGDSSSKLSQLQCQKVLQQE